MRYLPVSHPFLDIKETDYVNDALKSKAISGFFGEYTPRFEKSFASYCGTKYGVAVSSGTTALHIALVAIGIKQGDEVLVSTLTNMATFFAVLYQGAKPIPIDIESETLNMDPSILESKITSRTKAIMVVHLFGHPVDMDPVIGVAKKYRLAVVEDCAEAHGALYKDKKTGSLGDVGCFSFYANKIITTGEGGMVTTDDNALTEKMRSLKGLSFGHEFKFMHKDIGYNYKLTNLQAAIGCAQLEKIEMIIGNKRRIAAYYEQKLKDVQEIQLPVEKPYARNVFWMYHIVLKGKKADERQLIMKKLKEKGIETREGFIPYNLQNTFIERGLTNKEECPVANSVAYNSIYLPSGPVLREEEMDYVVDNLRNVIVSK